ncbi:MAG: hypothetical protein J6L70_00660 [Alphaproteobacteria bacterium]|nr:hypothetical protein [Alphaproteobacteria bacterium]
MKQISLAIILFSCLVATNAYALSKKSHEKVNLCVNMLGVSTCEMVEEKDVYQTVYNMKYDSYFGSSLEYFDKMGLDSHYFVDDMKKYTECYAEAFAKEVTMKDVNMIFDETTPPAAKNALIDNIAYKYVDKCKKKYAPYMNKMEDVLQVYLEKVCGSTTPSKSVAKKCKKQYKNEDDIIKCQQENDEWYKCLNKIMTDTGDKIMKNMAE